MFYYSTPNLGHWAHFGVRHRKSSRILIAPKNHQQSLFSFFFTVLSFRNLCSIPEIILKLNIFNAHFGTYSICCKTVATYIIPELVNWNWNSAWSVDCLIDRLWFTLIDKMVFPFFPFCIVITQCCGRNKLFFWIRILP